MATSYDEALATQSEEEVRGAVAEDLAARGVDDRGFPVTSTQRVILDSYAASMSRVTELRANATRAGSVELIQDIPEDDGRDAWIRQYFSRGYFGLPHDEATRARHRLVLTNVSTGLERTIQIGKSRARAGDIDFINIEGGKLLVGGTLALTYEAQTAGSIGNLPPNTITQLVTAIAGVTVNNPPIAGQGSSLVVPARDEESNETLLARDMARWGATSAGGARGSIVEWIDEAFKYAGVVKLVTKWGIDDENPLGPGSTAVYLGTDTGAASAEQVAIVQAYYNLRRTAGTGKLLVGPVTEVPLPYAATVFTNVNDAAGKIAAVDAEFTAQLPIGGKALRVELIRRIKNALGLSTQDNLVLDFEDRQLEPFEEGIFTGAISVA